MRAWTRMNVDGFCDDNADRRQPCLREGKVSGQEALTVDIKRRWSKDVGSCRVLAYRVECGRFG